jgi:pimeloyl-ACP methyl ester carboxylesterase
VPAVAALVGLGARRYAVRRGARVVDPLADEPFGALHGPVSEVKAEDGVVLCAEVCAQVRDDPPPAAGDPTLVFVPGFCLTMDAWHFQRRDLRDLGRCVFYDQRGHGRSARGVEEHATIEWLARDLRRILDELAPTGPVILVGHSLGGMVVMAFADAYPELFGTRIVGVALVATSPGRLAEVTHGLPAALTRLLRPYAPGVVDRVVVLPSVLERGMGADRDVGLLLTRRFSFGSARASPALVRFVGGMLSSTPLDVFAEFFPEFDRHDKEAALPVFQACPTLIVGGDEDRVTPADHSRAMAAVLPEAEVVIVPDAGHMVMLEFPEQVNDALRRLVDRVRLTLEVT